jgi:hypothetical protein
VKHALAVVAAFGLCGAHEARAESCTKSRDFILSAPFDLPRKPQAYQELFRACLDTLELSNVQDAFVLKDGAIAVLPRRDTISATASTLAQFCDRFPHGTLHFIGRKDRKRAAVMSQAVTLSSADPTPCEKIKGGG